MKAEPDKKPEATSLPEASLGGLVLSLSAAALAYMGEKVAPEGQNPDANLVLARHTIGTLEMLKAKTEGNRTPEEDKLFDEMLYQLRMAYVEAEEKQKSGQPEDAKTPEPDKAEGKKEPDKTAGPAEPGPGGKKN
jgi:hypothetical protein